MRRSYFVQRKEDKDSSDDGSELLLHRAVGEALRKSGGSKNTSMSMTDMVLDKFKGCLAGAMIGDCIGTLFECDYTVSYTSLGDLYYSLTNLSEDEKLMDLHGIDVSVGPKIAQELLERKRSTIAPFGLNGNKKDHPPPKRHSSSYETRRGSFSRPIEKFSDDTVMTRSVVRSLIRMKGFDARDMAIQLTEDYYLNLTRKFGGYSKEIFTLLRTAGYSDIYGPSRKVSGSIGSQGNEGATRTAPVALFAWKSEPSVVVEMASKLTKITNSHKSAVMGAAFQALAIHTAFKWDLIKDQDVPRARLRSRLSPSPSPQMRRKHRNQENIPMTGKSELDYKAFCNHIVEGVAHIESRAANLFENLKSLMSSSREQEIGEAAFIAKIQTIIQFLERTEPPSRAEVVEKLGNGVKAIDSVPTALYAFLLSATREKLSEIPVDITSPILRTIFYAISLGGDTDTTASMAGAIAGAFWGFKNIPQEILRVCEGSKETVKLANDLYTLCHNV